MSKNHNFKISVLATLLLVSCLGMAEAQVLYVVHGRVLAVQESDAALESTFTSAIPGVEPEEEPPIEPVPAGSIRHDSHTPLPGVIIEAYEKANGHLLGVGNANANGFFRIEYTHVLANHTAVFKVFLQPANGGKEFFGESKEIEIDSQLFGIEVEVYSEESFRAGTTTFASGGQFVFTEVGDVDMDNIYDRQADPTESDHWGLTKQTPTGGFDTPFNGHRLGPDLAFGGSLELYGLIEPTTTARYYRISYSGPVSGSIASGLWKKNYVITGTRVVTYREKMGPQIVGGESNLYRFDEFMVGEPVPGTTHVYSNFWTELGLRALWNTSSLPDGLYELSIERFDAAGNPVAGPPAGSVNDYATLSLYLVNTPPTAKIHSLHYLPPSEEPPVLSDAAPCQTVVLNHVSAPTFDDTLQFKLTAEHSTGFLRDFELYAWHGHSTGDGVIADGSYGLSFPLTAVGPNHAFYVTPGSISYQTCAYRFRLRVWPRITNGYHLIYVRDDNWYASVDVIVP